MTGWTGLPDSSGEIPHGEQKRALLFVLDPFGAAGTLEHRRRGFAVAPIHLCRLQEEVLRIQPEEAVVGKAALVQLPYLAAVLVFQRAVVDVEVQVLFEGERHESQGQHFAAGDRKAACIPVLEQHGERRILYLEATFCELLPVMERVAELEQVDARNPGPFQEEQHFAHLVVSAGDARGLHHDRRHVLFCQQDVGADLLPCCRRVVQLDAQADFRQPCGCQPSKQVLVKQVAGRVQAGVRRGKKRVAPLEEPHGLVGPAKGFPARQADAGRPAGLPGEVLQLFFPGIVVGEVVVVVLLVGVETEVTVPVAGERQIERPASARPRAGDAGGGEAAFHDACLAVAEHGTGFSQAFLELVRFLQGCAELFELDA